MVTDGFWIFCHQFRWDSLSCNQLPREAVEPHSWPMPSDFIIFTLLHLNSSELYIRLDISVCSSVEPSIIERPDLSCSYPRILLNAGCLVLCWFCINWKVNLRIEPSPTDINFSKSIFSPSPSFHFVYIWKSLLSSEYLTWMWRFSLQGNSGAIAMSLF